MTKSRKVIVDADPGQDDAVAILVALASPELEVLGITVVAGNVPLSLTSKNALLMTELAQRTEVPVFAGCDRPMEKALYTAEYVHGATGIDGAGLGEPAASLGSAHAVDFIVDTVMASEPGTITLCPLGPLTNVGTALKREPALADRLEAIVLMGGGFFEGGNTTPAAEFNIYVDPQAADIVFRSGVDITVMPLDVTHKAVTTDEWLARLRAHGSPVTESVAGMLEFYERWDVDKYGMEGGPLHDPTVIAYLLRPELFRGRVSNVVIETASSLTEGMTVVDYWQVTNRPPNALWVTEIDSAGFFELLYQRLVSLHP